MTTKSYLPLEPAQFELDDHNTPYSVIYGDVYHPTAGAMGQARHVFVAGSGMPEAWRDQDEYTILETGFGLGHNFLAAWEAWRNDSQRSRRLHFISVEKHPFSAQDLAQAHAHSHAPAELSAQLRAQWPVALPGFHRLHFDSNRVTLSVLFGEAEQMLSELRTQADAIFLDGFSPSRNPDMWSQPLFQLLAKFAHNKTRIATWSVSNYVRTGLAEAGFLTDKQSGFDRKREMLCGHLPTSVQKRSGPDDKRALVIGAGLAGTSVAERLAARGWEVQILEVAARPAQGASGNLAGAFRPLPSADESRLFQLTRAGFLYGSRHLRTLESEGLGARWSACGVLHLARDVAHEVKQREIVENLRAPRDFLRFVERGEATEIAGYPTAFGGWYFPHGGWVNPPSVCMANIARQHSRITCGYNQYIARLQRVAGLWNTVNDAGETLAEAPVVILANAADARRLGLTKWLPLRSARGQVTHLPEHSAPSLKAVVCGQGYVTPPVDGFIAAGATFYADDESSHIRLGDHLENLDKLNRMLPGYTSRDYPIDQLSGRVAYRPVSLDRLPIVGALPSVGAPEEIAAGASSPRHAGLYLISGFGARGIVWSALLGEYLASQINSDTSPLAQSLGERLDPARFLRR
ncbi:MAG: bifunctional tRNA (5-methylaminomethyl-2-thiouridine)(34)-methyltransferase MnmD/FAD-dependent 5-carboxymethylaminomethyl-2-thiouridine(34) oxidoreductase MnmC [Betaproteobacteria bacterium]|nr:bifunctional tRNA (5-methylaminomethyl-2-thiouridine)(34)-methyltransferase MnmD/FAD-dependent 5-carboxymethylaminomethyl-2-thiouridine(34) oxidoreductase MnmC [Betaproteobacteria bacterium]